MNRLILNKRLPFFGLILALILFVLSMIGNPPVEGTDKMASKVQERIEDRLHVLDGYIAQALEVSSDGDVFKMKIPEDMVIYRYVNDSLHSWCNQFTIVNDDISSKHIFQRLSDTKISRVSPLTEITERISFENLGSKWYLVKRVNGVNHESIIAGLYIKNTIIDDIRKTENGVNPHLKLSGKYSVLQLNHSGGTPVFIDSHPLFKVIQNPIQATINYDNAILRWLSLILLGLATVLFLARHRTFKVYFIVASTQIVLSLTALIWALKMQDSSAMFSPNLYADDGLMFSLGALLTINTLITTLSICTYVIKGRIADWMRSNRGKIRRRAILVVSIALVSVVSMFYYIHASIQSIVLNSSIPIELYRLGDNLAYSIIVYASYIFMIACMLPLLQMLRPAVYELTGRSYNLFSVSGIAAFAFIFSLYFTISVGIAGLNKEKSIVEVLANRLAAEREMELEIQLRQIEENIAADKYISSLVSQPNSAQMISGRISEYHMSRLKQSHRIRVESFLETDTKENAFTKAIRTGTPISKGSRFLFMNNENGHPYYAGAFIYYNQNVGVIRILVNIETISAREDTGYYSILGKFSKSRKMNFPLYYSYAKYKNNKLVSYKGSYPYPTAYKNFDREVLEDNKLSEEEKYLHFAHHISKDEVIIISRPSRNFLVFFTAFSYLFIILISLLYLITRKRNRKVVFKSTYFRTKINSILFASSFIILVSVTLVSIFFFYQRKEVNMTAVMSQKISTVQALIETKMTHAQSWHDLMSPAFRGAMEDLSNTTKADISIYTPEGKVFYSTTPEVFEKMILSNRMDEEAFYNIVYLNQRYFIHKEALDGYQFWSLYAPLFNDTGDLIALISIPYTNKDYDLKRESFFHLALIINLFLILLIVSLLFSTREVNSMFMPLIEMGKKMTAADIHNLEYIIYKREDEISSLVDAYNRMVHDLSDSTKQLAQAERDKAWSQMARQVAHEIKNPLTPIKLEIQRLIRLKQKNSPLWEEKFDKVSAVILEHIDILTDTANEFSTFAKLYSEEPVLIDLDKTLKEQLMIFDNRENIRISYIGMENAFVMAPKPQLIRVFVNLITNAIQAVEMRQKDLIESGAEPIKGKVLICLRNSTHDGCYDVVVDDNGSGVKTENISKLFTPNFTTKNSGTGLGLAICRNIVEKCDGEISYKKSYSLGGASFTVTLPKYKEGQST